MTEPIFSKIAGVSFEGRQDLIKDLKAGDELQVERDPKNEYDSHAVKILHNKIQIGFINRMLAYEMSKAMSSGLKYKCFVSDVTGGKEGQNIGVNIRIERDET